MESINWLTFIRVQGYRPLSATCELGCLETGARQGRDGQ